MTVSKRKIVLLVVIVIIAWFIYMNGYKPCKKYSFINENGEVIANIRYEEFEGCIEVEKNEYYIFSAHNRFKQNNPLFKEMLFIVDNKGKTIMKSTTGNKGKLSVDTVNNLLLYKNNYIFIDSKGKIIYKAPENKIITKGKNICGIVPFYYRANKKSGLENEKIFGYVNMKDEVVVEPQFSEAYDFNEEGLARVRVATEDGKYGFIDTSGNFVISPIYDDAGDFSDGVAWVDYNGKAVYIDTKGNIVLEKEGFDFHDGITEVRNESDKYAYMNKNGDLITEYAFDMAYGFCNGYGLVNVDGRKGVVDTKGNIVIEPQFGELYYFSEEGLAGARGDNGLYGYINTSGEWVIEPKYECVFDFDNGTSLVEMNR